MGRGRRVTIARLMILTLISAVVLAAYHWVDSLSPAAFANVSIAAILAASFVLGAFAFIVGVAALARWIFGPPSRRGGPPPEA